MSTETVLVYLFVVLVLYVLAHLFIGPLRMAVKFLLYPCLGAGLLVFANLVGGLFGATVALNPYNVLVAGFLNLPGVILLFLLRFWLRL